MMPISKCFTIFHMIIKLTCVSGNKAKRHSFIEAHSTVNRMQKSFAVNAKIFLCWMSSWMRIISLLEEHFADDNLCVRAIHHRNNNFFFISLMLRTISCLNFNFWWAFVNNLLCVFITSFSLNTFLYVFMFLNSNKIFFLFCWYSN